MDTQPSLTPADSQATEVIYDAPDLKYFLIGLFLSPIGIVIWFHDHKIIPKRAGSALKGVLLAAFIYLFIVGLILVFGKKAYQASHPGWRPDVVLPAKPQ